jgi:hypothetical protein
MDGRPRDACCTGKLPHAQQPGKAQDELSFALDPRVLQSVHAATPPPLHLGEAGVIEPLPRPPRHALGRGLNLGKGKRHGEVVELRRLL